MTRPASFPGWLLEPGGDARPRRMTVAPQGEQNPAYRPTPFTFLKPTSTAFAVEVGGMNACSEPAFRATVIWRKKTLLKKQKIPSIQSP